jgi:two-component system KDP operon response regulator KdpE
MSMYRPAPIRLLIVDDEAPMRAALRASFRTFGYETVEAASGEAAIEAICGNPALILMDLNMPGMGGLEACRRVRQLAPEIGIVVLSVRDGEEDKLRAFEAGADDYVTKPFRLRELAARLNAVRRRLAGGQLHAPLRSGELELDGEARTVRKAGQEIRLSQKEFDILHYLMRHPGTTVPHARLLQAVWGPEYGGETEYLRTYVKHLRRKIEDDAAHPEYIVTEPWLGYRFCEESRMALRPAG